MITVYGLHTEQNDFANCGLAVLHPTSAYITEELNGRYDLEIDVPCIHDDPHGDNDTWKYVRVYNILKASNGQLFQINKVQYYTKSGVPYVKAYAPHIWYYLSDMCVFHAESYTEAYWAMVDLFTERTRGDDPHGTTWFSHGAGLTDYNFDWSIVGAGERYYKFDYTSLANAILGNSDSICNLWGLEIHRDNFRFSLRPRKEGTSDGAFYLKYGINCTDVKFTYDSSSRKTELHMHDNGGDTTAISYDPILGLFPHQAISGAYMTYENPSIDLLSQDRGIYWDEVSQIKSTWEVNYVDFHLTDHETGYERPLKVGDAGTVEDAIGNKTDDIRIISLKTNDLTNRVEQIKLGHFISSGLHQSRWDRKVLATNDTPEGKRVSYLENNINREAGQISDITGDISNINGDIGNINNSINDINAAIEDIYSKLPPQNP